MRRHIRAPEALAALALVAALAGCAKKGPPTGGPPDLEPPRLVGATPDSGAAGVATNTRISVTFSEGMEPRATGDALELAPPVAIRQRRWAGRTLTLVLKDSLKADHTYTLFVGSGARDRHGNNLVDPRTIVFTTSKEFPPGGLQGRIEAVGFHAATTTLWCYRDGRQPDSTARDFDALGVTDATGEFRIGGLAVPATWRVWGFADLNHNRSFEPLTDLLVRADTVLELTAEHPVATGIRLRMVNPHAPGRFAGTVLDSVSDQSGVARIIMSSVTDTTRRLVYEVPESGSFDFQWDAGIYRVRAYRDLDRNKAWKRDTEPASDEFEVRIDPGSETIGFQFVLRRPVKEGTGP
jgi:predicted small lipoprotein YifL